MSEFIVAIPLFNHAMAVNMYSLSHHNGEKILGMSSDYQRMNEVIASPALEMVERFGIEAFAGDKPLLVDATKFQLLSDLPLSINIRADKLIFLMAGEMADDPDVQNKCKYLKELGYAFALRDYPSPEHIHLIDSVDYVLLDYGDPQFFFKNSNLGRKHRRITPVITNIPDMAAFQSLKNNQRALFTGDFYNQPITEGVTVLSPLKINAMHLISQVNQDDFDLSDIVHIIEHDPYLTISLLRFINSRASGLNKKVDSIKSAVAILGQKEVRRWATVALSITLAEDRPGEITKLSLTRAKFAENLAGAFEMGVFQPDLFLAGLFSLLDVILEMPMEKAVSEVFVNDLIAEALVRRMGPLFEVLDLIYAYERADWDRTAIIMIQHNIRAEAISNAFVEALIWYSQLLQSIDEEAEAPPGEAQTTE